MDDWFVKMAREYKRAVREYVEKHRDTYRGADVIHTYIMMLPEEQLAEELRRLAKRFRGCVSCVHSAPVPWHPSLTARTCKLGLRQDTCGRYTPVV